MLLALGLVLLARPALGTTAADLCAANADPCVVDGTISVTTGSTLDLGARALEVTRTGTLDVGGGTMTIRAGSLRLVAGAVLSGRGGTITIVTTGPISVEASGTTQSRIDVSNGAQGGAIDLTAGGPVTVAGTLT